MCINMHIVMMAERREPSGAANPIGKRVSAKSFDAKYATGIRTRAADAILDINEYMALLYAQKNPPRQKCIPAKNVSKA